MKNSSKIIYGLLICLSLAFVACYVPRTATEKEAPSYKYDFSSLYNPAESSFHPDVRIYTEDVNQAIVFFRIASDEIKANLRSPYDTSFNLITKYALRDVSSFEIVDSGLNVFNISTDFNSKYVEMYFRIKINPEKSYKLILGFTGDKSGNGSRIILDVDNKSEFASEKFIPENINNGVYILYDNFVYPNEIYRIRSAIFERETCKIEYYKFGNYVVVPPYYIDKSGNDLILPDSVFKYQIGDTVSFIREGYYILKSSVQNVGSICLINGGSAFPQIKKLSDMHEPIKLVGTDKEIRAIDEAEILKDAIDVFWLNKSNNKKFAREQIRVFYNRVELANKYFSDYREGWKTDRGNIYVILGPPTVVNMSSDGEEWFYGENPDVAGILFIFDKGVSFTGDAIYRLRRDAVYQTLWAQAITTWRNGRVFTITKN